MNAIKIIDAKYLSDYKIGFKFSNGKHTVVDFKNFIFQHRSPHVTPFKNLDKFKKFKIKFDRDIVWGRNYDMAFEFETLCKGGSIPPPDIEKIKKITIAYFGKKKAEKMFVEAEMV